MSTLPPPIAALWFACQCFDVQEADIHPVKRQPLHRAINNGPISSHQLEEIERKLRAVLFPKFRQADVAPRGLAIGVADSIVVMTLKIYGDLLPLLKYHKASSADVLRVICREAILPTIHLILAKHQIGGLGTEFRRDSCWYAPQTMDEKMVGPLALVLDRWLRAAGFRTAYGVSKANVSSRPEEEDARWESEKKQVKRWLDGKTTPSLEKLHALVRKFPQNVAWLDTAESWCARFTLAYGLGKACDALKKIWGAKGECPLQAVAATLHGLSRETIWEDDEKLLTEPSVFFAVRLWVQDLKKTGELDTLMSRCPQSFSQHFEADVPDAELERRKRESNREMDFGNHLARHLLVTVGQPLAIPDLTAYLHRQEAVRRYLLEFAARRLNSLIEKEYKNAGRRNTLRRSRRFTSENQSP